MLKTVAFISSLLGALLAAAVVYGNMRDSVQVVWNGHLFTIPKKNIVTEVPFWIRLTPGYYEDPDEMLLRFDADHMKSVIPEYIARDGQLKTDIIVNLKAMDQKDADVYRNPDTYTYRDAWYGEGRYDERVVEVHELTGFYKVYNPNYPIWWSALKIYPDADKPIPERVEDFWIAGCRDGKAPATASGRITRCGVNAFHHSNIFFSFTVTVENLHLHEELKRYVSDQLASWETRNATVDL